MAGDLSFLGHLENVLKEKQNANPETSYTAKLFSMGIDKILQKVGEESIEYILDAKNDNRERMISEGADLLYHFTVSLIARGVSLADIAAELERRHKPLQP